MGGHLLVNLHYAKVGAALVDAREHGRDPFAAVEAVVPWESFFASVKEAAELARGEDFDAVSLYRRALSPTSTLWARVD